MAGRPWALIPLVAAAALALAACGRQSGGELPHADSSGGAVVPGATGKGTGEAGSSPQAPGVGLNGGLGGGHAAVASSTPATGTATGAPAGTGPDSATPGGNGSPNTTTHSSVGNR